MYKLKAIFFIRFVVSFLSGGREGGRRRSMIIFFLFLSTNTINVNTDLGSKILILHFGRLRSYAIT